MFRTLTPIIAILIGIGLLTTYVRPTFEAVGALQDETEDYAQAIDRADALRTRINELVAKQNAFSSVDLERLEAFLPDRVDEVSLMLDLDALATQHRLAFGNISVKNNVSVEEVTEARAIADDIDPAAPQQERAVSSGAAYVPMDISFTVTGTYQDFRSYLRELERSLLLMDVVRISFAESDGDLTDYNLTVRAYSFKKGN